MRAQRRHYSREHAPSLADEDAHALHVYAAGRRQEQLEASSSVHMRLSCARAHCHALTGRRAHIGCESGEGL